MGRKRADGHTASEQYVSPVLDLYPSDLVSFTISGCQLLSMVMYMAKYQSPLNGHHVCQRMSGQCNCLDSAVIESCFGLPKSELLHLHTFEPMVQFKSELRAYLDHYNHRGIKQKLKCVSPALPRMHHALHTV